MTGIYKITCTITGEVYIGQSTSISRRWATHKRELRQGIHYNKHMQRTYDRYGAETFVYEVLEQCPAKKLNEREQFYIKMFDSKNKGFNQDWGGCDIRGEHNPMFGIKGDRGPRFIDYILRLSSEGEILNEFDSTIAAAKAIGCAPSSVLKCLNTWRGKDYDDRRHFSIKKFQFIYKQDYEKLLPYHNFDHIVKKGEKYITTKMIDEGTLDSDI